MNRSKEVVVNNSVSPARAALGFLTMTAVAAVLWAGAAYSAEAAKKGAAPTAKETAAPAGEGQESAEEADWPCSQKFVAQLSPGTIWTGPPLDAALKSWHDNDKLRDIITKLSDDTTEEADGNKAITEFAAGLGADKDKGLTELFAGLFETMNNQRTSTQDGIKRFFRREKDVATKINKVEAGIRELDKKGVKHDSAQYVEAKKQLMWNNRVYDERQKLTPFVCEVPILIEQRLGSYGRTILAQMSNQGGNP